MSIGKSQLTQWMVLVDDLRIFGANPPREERAESLAGYPTAAELVTAFRELDPKVELGVWGDTLIAVSSSLNRPLDEISTALLASRVYESSSMSDDAGLAAALHAEHNLIKCSSSVAKGLATLARGFANSETFGLGGHYHLWAGLTRLRAGSWNEAAADFRRAINLDLNHWRVDCYLAQALLGSGARLDAFQIVSALEKSGIVHPFLKTTVDRVLQEVSPARCRKSCELPILELARRLLPESPVIFDAGAGTGDWSADAIRIFSQPELHCFEGAPNSHDLLLRRLIADGGSVVINSMAASCSGAASPRDPSVSLDDYCSGRSIRRIHCLNLGNARDEYCIVTGAKEMLARGDVDMILCRRLESDMLAEDDADKLVQLLQSHGLSVFITCPEGIRPIDSTAISSTKQSCLHLVAVHPRLAGHMEG
ncbi:MAG: hypothetical protein K8R87_11380, partial [Verrucomicrobia bacterium]|nr:hypothetical protein [Verrucomicrobiota bacterium]